MWDMQYLQCGAVKTRSIFPQLSTQRASYGVSFVDPASDWYSASVPVTIYAVSYYIGPRNNGPLLYINDDVHTLM